MKKFLTFLLAAAMCLAVCSCGSSTTTGTDGEVVTLTWYVPGDAQNDLASVLEEANKITEEKIGVKIDMQFIDNGAYSEKMNMKMASGEAYDICFTGYLNKYSNAVSKGGLMQLDELLETTPELKKAIPDYLWDAVKYQGGIYAVPNQQINATRYTPFTFKELADKYGLDVDSIKKHTDLEPYFEKIKNGEPNMIPYRPQGGGYFSISDDPDFRGFEEITQGFGIVRGDKDAKVIFTYDTPEYQAGVAKRNEWLQKGYIREDILSVGDDSIDLKSGKYAVWCAVYKPGIENDLTKQYGKEVVAMTNVGKAYVTQSSCTSTMLAIGRNCKNPEKAIKLIELMNTDKDLYNIIGYGIEGKHYELTPENKVKFIDNSGYKVDTWKFGNQFNAYVVDGAEDDVWEQTAKINEEAEKSVIISLMFDTAPITTELSNAKAVFDEYSYVIQGLTLDYKEHESEYRAKLNEVGIDKIIAEIQRQVDEALGK